MTTSEAQASAPDLFELAVALGSCRDVYMTIFNEGLTDARLGSQAQTDLSAKLTGPGGPWPDGYVNSAQAMAIKLVRQQADLCVAAGVLIAAGERIDPLAAVARTAFEYGSRAFWVLEPGTDLKTRCARALLMELVSLDIVKAYVSVRRDETKVADEAEVNQLWKRMRSKAEHMFEVSIKDDVKKSRLDNVTYERWTEIGKRWLKAAKASVDGDALYHLLAIRTHPQGFLATHGLVFENGELRRKLTDDAVQQTGSMLLSMFYTSLTLVISYHGHQSEALPAWKASLQSIPLVFNNELDSEP